MTKLLRDENGSLGSRLHKTIEELPSDTSVTYIAYAQWPSEEAWLNNTNTTPAGQEARKQMRESLIEGQSASEVVFKLNVLEDLLAQP